MGVSGETNAPSGLVTRPGPYSRRLLFIPRIFCANDFLRDSPPASVGDCSLSRLCIAVLDAGAPSRKVDVPNPNVSSPWIGSIRVVAL